jgi:hypothetical protein
LYYSGYISFIYQAAVSLRKHSKHPSETFQASFMRQLIHPSRDGQYILQNMYIPYILQDTFHTSFRRDIHPSSPYVLQEIGLTSFRRQSTGPSGVGTYIFQEIVHTSFKRQSLHPSGDNPLILRN